MCCLLGNAGFLEVGVDDGCNVGHELVDGAEGRTAGGEHDGLSLVLQLHVVLACVSG